MKRLIFLNRFFFPDQSATSQILSDLAFYLAECGRDVHVVTSRQLYEDPKARLPARETVRGVTIHRVFSTQFGRTSLVGRALDYLSYYASTMLKLVNFTDAGDIVIAKTDPPLISVVAMWAARLRHATLVNWLQDIYPEIAIEMGVPFAKGPAGRCLSFLRDASLKTAAANVAVGEQMAVRLQSRGASSDRVHFIPNWCDDEEIVPISHSDNPLRKAWDLQTKFVVGYSGNLGRGHEFDTLLAASERFREDPHLTFVLIGGGHRFEELKRLVKAKGLDLIYRFFPYQDRKLLKYSLSVPDVHWISLQPALSDLMFPSKFYGIAAAGRPILALTGKQGEIARLVRDHDCGFAINPGDVTATADAIALLVQDRAHCEKMGLNARAMLDSKFTRRRALEQWKSLLDHLPSG
jgi:glycosyltransferase involved in cell wall biosynthesis